MIRILQISDTHILPEGQLFQGRIDTAAALTRLLHGLKQLLPRIGPVARIVVSGDLTETGCAAAYGHFLRLMQDSPLPWLATPGNHDARAPMRAALQGRDWMPTTGPVNWQQDLDEVILIGLDTLVEGAAHGELSLETCNWLDAQLARAGGRPVLLFLHHPPVGTGIAAMNEIGLKMPERLSEILARYRGPLQIGCGHIHRMSMGIFASFPLATAPGASHSIALDPEGKGPLAWVDGGSGAILHSFDGGFRTDLITLHDFGATVAFS